VGAAVTGLLVAGLVVAPPPALATPDDEESTETARHRGARTG
jgi:hypothetical protein